MYNVCILENCIFILMLVYMYAENKEYFTQHVVSCDLFSGAQA